MSDTWNIRDCFEQMRFDKGVHLGLGDIRLSIGTQDDICDLVEQHHGKPGEVARLRAENERLRDVLQESFARILCHHHLLIRYDKDRLKVDWGLFDKSCSYCDLSNRVFKLLTRVEALAGKEGE